MVTKELTVPQKLYLVVASSCSVKSWYFDYAFSFVCPGRSASACLSPFYFAHWPQRDLRSRVRTVSVCGSTHSAKPRFFPTLPPEVDSASLQPPLHVLTLGSETQGVGPVQSHTARRAVDLGFNT